ncbi:ORF84 similar to AcMNPV ORF102 [Cydia pomonella granulovirus]|uniref:p12 n=2 Tax=Cydia pomonella granulosis virus TaxID=28289 RepID=A0A097P2C6_GVCP|nr:ORF84 similar to AcMNPV ORF102 [Cydia pomonella granulovirus]AAK70744.1 ORF84 similar to AcMNPV ORF102 [Cydia pomonella granulovirus]AIU36731.1 ORF84 p12 [Cydia pomonella granulovirus]AIU36867.1 ORF84 p12 [Cydia pomonella granulovirus]AIU37010.1 ORF84 p12 [Cydia pomonella granulovirus]AIU37152.1 ORF84 p12 [Cydia pomonella granulovirus]
MEDSLFNRNAPPPPPVSSNQNNEALLSALLMQGVGRHIKEDTSPGKKSVLAKLAPKTRSLKRMLNGIDEDNDHIIVRGADDAIDILEVVYGIVNSKFVIQEDANSMIVD